LPPLDALLKFTGQLALRGKGTFIIKPNKVASSIFFRNSRTVYRHQEVGDLRG